ncbi:response regulator [Anaeromyxobacter oryzisoli]|uniref:response regulator n=1 Tax=Anaeromyxobacter oryzisoli TaxID=2925408 RepID=UPI001F57427C|nr:response regulator [Anaeromyxobacter sp. SG63]
MPLSSVLVVEDDPDLLALLDMVLAGAGYRVRTAAHGAEALERVLEEMPGVILLDMRMPIMNGWEFARELQARYDHPCPIVVLTAAENADQRAAEIGAEGWLSKPFDIDDVLASVARQLAARAGGAPVAPPGA